MAASCTVKPIAEFKGERRTYEGVVQPFAAHSHDYYVIGKVREGNRKLNLNGSNLAIAQGDMVLFNPGDVHSCNQIGNAPFAYDSLAIPRGFFDGTALRFPGASDKSACACFERTLALLDGGQVDEAVDELVKIGDLLKLASSSSREEGMHDQLVTKLFANIKGHLAKQIAVCEFARSEGISPYALIRAYKRKFSITPTQHLLSLRFEAARELLAKGARVSDVAAELGFVDQPHLTRVFKQRIGITPAAYRSMMLRRA